MFTSWSKLKSSCECWHAFQHSVWITPRGAKHKQIVSLKNPPSLSLCSITWLFSSGRDRRVAALSAAFPNLLGEGAWILPGSLVYFAEAPVPGVGISWRTPEHKLLACNWERYTSRGIPHCASNIPSFQFAGLGTGRVLLPHLCTISRFRCAVLSRLLREHSLCVFRWDVLCL